MKTADQRSAHNIVKRAVQSGELVRPDACERCGDKLYAKYADHAIDAHHADYSKPLEVEWLCRSCHIRHHFEERKARLMGWEEEKVA